MAYISSYSDISCSAQLQNGARDHLGKCQTKAAVYSQHSCPDDSRKPFLLRHGSLAYLPCPRQGQLAADGTNVEPAPELTGCPTLVQTPHPGCHLHGSTTRAMNTLARRPPSAELCTSNLECCFGI